MNYDDISYLMIIWERLAGAVEPCIQALFPIDLLRRYDAVKRDDAAYGAFHSATVTSVFSRLSLQLTSPCRVARETTR